MTAQAPFQNNLNKEKIRDWKKIKQESKEKQITSCLYCSSKNIVKRGTRKKKLETIQLYKCKDCNKTFTPIIHKHKQYPLKTIIDAISYYNLGYTKIESCNLIKENYGYSIVPLTLTNWLEEFQHLCTYSRLREQGKKLFTPNQVIESVRLHHKQVYNFQYHKAKLNLLIQDYKHEKFESLREFLEVVKDECPHQFFQEDNERSSQQKPNFNLEQVRIVEKHNFANRLTNLILQAINNNRQRHEILQRFMMANDSTTVACEVPIWLDKEDIEHFNSELGFRVPLKPEKIITGHIDLLQIRNGSIHILDYKPNAKKEKPIEQLTIYALALSRLTGLRLYEFKAAWFDENNYFEFFPLHVVYKIKNKKRFPKEQTKLNLIKFSPNHVAV